MLQIIRQPASEICRESASRSRARGNRGSNRQAEGRPAVICDRQRPAPGYSETQR